jgi:hypothetical protein
MLKNLIEQYVSTLIEAKVREADTSDGNRVSWGSEEHINDLKARIASMEFWRNKYKKGSESRANYSRIIGRLKNELRAAERRNNDERKS